MCFYRKRFGMDFATYDNIKIIKDKIFNKIHSTFKSYIEYTDKKIEILEETIYSKTIPKVNSITSGTVGKKEDTVGTIIEIPWIYVNENGIVTAYGTRKHTIINGGDDM